MPNTSVDSNPFTTAAIALQARPPARVARMVSLFICAIAVLTLVFACFVTMDVVVTAQGRIIAPGKSKVVQPLETGIVRTIFVKDGQRVKAGDVLIELDPTNAVADSERLQREFLDSDADVRRTHALLDGKAKLAAAPDTPGDIKSNQQGMFKSRQAEQSAKLQALNAEVARRQADCNALEASVAHLRSSVPLVEQKTQMKQELASSGFVAQASLIESQLEFINMKKELQMQTHRLQEAIASLNAAIAQRAQAQAEFRLQTGLELGEATKKREAARQELIKANQRRQLQVLKAPVDGVVQQLAVTTVGGVVTQAQALMTIVPDGASFEVEAQVINRDIGQIKIGQRVINKVETFDFTRYGYIEGQVSWVGTDAVVDQKLGPVYPVRIKLGATQTPNVAYGRKGVITAGMSVTADIKTDKRRMIEYFVAPLLRYKDESLRER